MNKKYNGIWVYAEQLDGTTAPVVYELLYKARQLADEQNSYVGVVLIGDYVFHETCDLIKHGADRLFVVENQALKNFSVLTYSNIVTQLVEEYKPDVFLAGATVNGRALASRVAIKLKTGLTADCTELYLDKETGNLVQTRPAFGGNLMAQIICPENRPQMATIRYKVLPRAIADDSRTGEIINIGFERSLFDSRVRFMDFFKDAKSSINLAEADIVVAGGRGVGTKENFKSIEHLANKLGAAIGASRAAVDLGWIEYIHQVGQTGTTVSPKIYIACGISGQIQHLVGMQSADMIISINKDKNAPIFKIADYGIVGDLNEVIQELLVQI